MEHRFPNWVSQNQSAAVRNFHDLTDATRPLLGRQTNEVAERTIRALFSAFVAIGIQKSDGKPSIQKIVFDPPGNTIQLVISWSAHTQLAQDAQALFNQTDEIIALPPRGKTLRALVDFIMLSMVNNEGLGSRSRLFLENNVVTLG